MNFSLNFNNELLCGRTSLQLYSGQVFPVPANHENQVYRELCQSLKSTPQFCKHYKFLQTLLWIRVVYSSTFLKLNVLQAAVVAQTPATYISMYWNVSASFFATVWGLQFKKFKEVIEIISYSVSELRQKFQASLFMTTKWARPQFCEEFARG